MALPTPRLSDGANCPSDLPIERQVWLVPREKAMPASMFGLTLRETQVLTLIAHGESAREIGNILEITKRTAHSHAQSIIQKLGATNRPQAVAIAIREHIVDMN